VLLLTTFQGMRTVCATSMASYHSEGVALCGLLTAIVRVCGARRCGVLALLTDTTVLCGARGSCV
jgi:hypothetical protein